MNKIFSSLRDIEGGLHFYKPFKRLLDKYTVNLQIGSTIRAESRFKPETTRPLRDSDAKQKIGRDQ